MVCLRESQSDEPGYLPHIPGEELPQHLFQDSICTKLPHLRPILLQCIYRMYPFRRMVHKRHIPSPLVFRSVIDLKQIQSFQN